MRLRNKVASVTGAASGFGAEIARLSPLRVPLLRSSTSTKQVREASALKSETLRRPSGATSQWVLRCAMRLKQRKDLRPSDIVVNNAGTTHRNKPMLEVTEAEFDKVYAVNVKSIFHMALSPRCQPCAPRAVAFFSISVRRLAYGHVQDLLGTTDQKAP